MLRFAGVLCIGLLAACSQTAEKIETAANRSTTSWSLGKPYTQVAALGNSPLDQLAADQTGFGPLIGQSRLSDGSTIYRHIAPSAQSESYSDFGGLAASNQQVTNYRLSYFKVGRDGIVSDWAAGKASSSISSCVSYIAGIFQKCTEQARIDQAVEIYDTLVRTRSGGAITEWGTILQPNALSQN